MGAWRKQGKLSTCFYSCITNISKLGAGSEQWGLVTSWKHKLPTTYLQRDDEDPYSKLMGGRPTTRLIGLDSDGGAQATYGFERLVALLPIVGFHAGKIAPFN